MSCACYVLDLGQKRRHTPEKRNVRHAFNYGEQGILAVNRLSKNMAGFDLDACNR